MKIDRAFILDIPGDPNASAIAKMILSLGHTLNLHVVAEGVETQEQLDFLSGAGCDAIQGYYFSKPVPFEEFKELLKQEKYSEFP